MKVHDQMRKLKDSFETSNHAFLTAICNAVAGKLVDDAKIEVVQTGKKVHGNTIEVTLVGQSVDPEVNEDIEKRVRQTMAELKNPASLIDLLK